MLSKKEAEKFCAAVKKFAEVANKEEVSLFEESIIQQIESFNNCLEVNDYYNEFMFNNADSLFDYYFGLNIKDLKLFEVGC